MAHRIGAMEPILGVNRDELFKVASEVGFDCVELNVGGDHETDSLYDHDGRKKLKGLADATGVRIASVCLGAFWGLPPASPDEAVRREAAKLLEDTIDASAELGASTILAPLTENDSTRNEPLDIQRERWTEMLVRAGKRADELGVDVALEACTREYARTAEQVKALAESSGREHVGVYYDPGNSVIAGLDPAPEIRLHGGLIRGFHVKDHGGAYLGEGKVDFPAVIAALKETGYAGALILETGAGDDPRSSAARNLEFTRKHFNA